jgi:hypothetical protein
MLISGQTEELLCNLWPGYFSVIFYAFYVKRSVKVGNWNKITDFYGPYSGYNGTRIRSISCCFYKDFFAKIRLQTSPRKYVLCVRMYRIGRV